MKDSLKTTSIDEEEANSFYEEYKSVLCDNCHEKLRLHATKYEGKNVNKGYLRLRFHASMAKWFNSCCDDCKISLIKVGRGFKR